MSKNTDFLIKCISITDHFSPFFWESLYYRPTLLMQTELWSLQSYTISNKMNRKIFKSLSAPEKSLSLNEKCVCQSVCSQKNYLKLLTVLNLLMFHREKLFTFQFLACFVSLLSVWGQLKADDVRIAMTRFSAQSALVQKSTLSPVTHREELTRSKHPLVCQ